MGDVLSDLSSSIIEEVGTKFREEWVDQFGFMHNWKGRLSETGASRLKRGTESFFAKSWELPLQFGVRVCIVIYRCHREITRC